MSVGSYISGLGSVVGEKADLRQGIQRGLGGIGHGGGRWGCGIGCSILVLLRVHGVRSLLFLFVIELIRKSLVLGEAPGRLACRSVGFGHRGSGSLVRVSSLGHGRGLHDLARGHGGFLPTADADAVC